MSLDYHLVDPLGDDEMKRMSSNLMYLMAVDQEVFGLKSWTRSAKSCQQLFNPSNPA
jgi:hypothetical protein